MKRIIHYYGSLFFLLIFTSLQLLQAQNSGAIKGKVITSDKENALFVNVILKGTNLGAVTNSEGIFEIRYVIPGTYQLAFSLIGLEEKTVEIEVKKG